MEKYGYINSDGRLIIQCKYHNALPFENGLARVRMGRKWGLVDTTGRVRLLCNRYNLIQKQCDNVFVVGIQNYDSVKFGAIDCYGKEILPCQYDLLQNFHNGICTFNIGGTVNLRNRKISGGKWGLIDKQNKVLVQPTYDFISPFINGYARVRLGINMVL